MAARGTYTWLRRHVRGMYVSRRGGRSDVPRPRLAVTLASGIIAACAGRLRAGRPLGAHRPAGDRARRRARRVRLSRPYGADPAHVFSPSFICGIAVDRLPRPGRGVRRPLHRRARRLAGRALPLARAGRQPGLHPGPSDARRASASRRSARSRAASASTRCSPRRPSLALVAEHRRSSASLMDILDGRPVRLSLSDAVRASRRRSRSASR